nr:uncharacterized protein LOC121120734 [Lepeophtheirus salmonis]
MLLLVSAMCIWICSANTTSNFSLPRFLKDRPFMDELLEWKKLLIYRLTLFDNISGILKNTRFTSTEAVLCPIASYQLIRHTALALIHFKKTTNSTPSTQKELISFFQNKSREIQLSLIALEEINIKETSSEIKTHNLVFQFFNNFYSKWMSDQLIFSIGTKFQNVKKPCFFILHNTSGYMNLEFLSIDQIELSNEHLW